MGSGTSKWKKSCWLAVGVEAHNGAVAHTSPIYVSVDGKPTWDPTQLDRIVALRLKRLAIMKAFLTDDPDGILGKKPDQLERRQATLLAQFNNSKEGFLVRLEKARKFYETLLEKAKL